MKLFIFLTIFIISQVAHSAMLTFTVVSENGFTIKCNEILTDSIRTNDLIKISHLIDFQKTQALAQNECALKTEKLCGIVSWGAKMYLKADGPNKGVEFCRPFAVAAPINQ